MIYKYDLKILKNINVDVSTGKTSWEAFFLVKSYSLTRKFGENKIKYVDYSKKCKIFKENGVNVTV